MLAANAGADYVSPFIGRIDDIGWDGLALIEEIADLFETQAIPTEVLAASIRNLYTLSKVLNWGQTLQLALLKALCLY